MDPKLKQDIADDIDLAKTMSEINSPAEVLDLTNRIISYLDLVLSTKARLQFELDQISGKQRVLEEFMRTGKARYNELVKITQQWK